MKRLALYGSMLVLATLLAACAASLRAGPIGGGVSAF